MGRDSLLKNPDFGKAWILKELPLLYLLEVKNRY